MLEGHMKHLLPFLSLILLAGCSLFSAKDVEISPYDVVKADTAKNIEIREYKPMVWVSAPMVDKDGRNNAFRTLFAYIQGANEGTQKIAMTAPVFMDKEVEGAKIPMTAPVFMDAESAKPMMSFVMPADYTLATTPKPTDPSVTVHELKDYKVAVIRFNGRLSDANIDKHRKILENWITENKLEVTGNYQSAGYNPPFTLPVLKRNEVLVTIK
jgi:hypothetical protein